MRFIACLGAVVWLSLSAASPAIAKPVRPTIIQIPFAPPLDRDLHYEVTISKSSPGKSSKLQIAEILRFSRSPDGYILTINMTRLSDGKTSFDLSSEKGMAALPLELRPFLLPISLDVAKDGSLTRVRDWPRLQRAIADLPKLMSKITGSSEDPKLARNIGEKIIDPFAALTAEQAASTMLKGWPAFFGYGGVEMEEGEEYEAEGEVAGTLLPVTMPILQRMSVSRDGAGNLRYLQTTYRDPEQVRKVSKEYILRLGDGLDAAHRANVEKAAEMMAKMTMEDYLDINFDPVSGLVEKATSERRFKMEEMGEGNETTSVLKLN